MKHLGPRLDVFGILDRQQNSMGFVTGTRHVPSNLAEGSSDIGEILWGRL